MSRITNNALFLDRDGLLIFDKEYISNPDDVELIPGADEALKLALEKKYHLFLLTNQSGVGRGFFKMKDVDACNERMLSLLNLPSPGFTQICIAPEAPDQPKFYRKPSPKFILEMIEKYKLAHEQCYMVGDRESDLQAGINAKINSVAAGKESKIIVNNTKKNNPNSEMNISASHDLLEFVSRL